jgi:hypothetical protein
VKPLALSPPLTREEYDRLRVPIKLIADDYNVHILVDEDFLTTMLFNPAYTEGKVVIHLAKKASTLERYKALKELKAKMRREDKPREAEEEIAVGLGHLLGYDDETIMRLLKKPRF